MLDWIRYYRPLRRRLVKLALCHRTPRLIRRWLTRFLLPDEAHIIFPPREQRNG